MNKCHFCLLLMLGTTLFLAVPVVESKSRSKRAFPVISEAVDAHNKLRKGEGATNMNKLVWDEVLAEMADKWAKNCDFTHGQPTSPVPEDDDVGQNLYASSSTSSSTNWTFVVQKWFDEKQYYTYDNLSCITGKMCGHYTQVVWADSLKVGCAVFVCTTLKSVKWGAGTLAVCNYSPAGNYVGEQPYLKGEPCSACKKCEDGLCVQ